MLWLNVWRGVLESGCPSGLLSPSGCRGCHTVQCCPQLQSSLGVLSFSSESPFLGSGELRLGFSGRSTGCWSVARPFLNPMIAGWWSPRPGTCAPRTSAPAIPGERRKGSRGWRCGRARLPRAGLSRTPAGSAGARASGSPWHVPICPLMCLNKGYRR